MSRCAVLVTGGAGYVGSHACKALALAGHVPVTLDDLTAGHRWAVQWGPLVEGDAGDAALVRRTIARYGITAVMHFAGHAYVGESMRTPARYFRNNVVNALALLDAMRGSGIGHVVFSSTCAVYGLPQRLPIEEDHAAQPISPYGESKLFVEKALAWYERAYGMRAVALRYFNAAGADHDGDIGEAHDPETHLIPLAIRAALTRTRLQVNGTGHATPDGTAVRDYVHVADLAAAHVLALEYLCAGNAGAVFNLGTGRGHSVLEVIRAVGQAAGRPVRWHAAPARPGDPPVLVAASQRAHETLGWAPQRSDLATIVASALRWQERGGNRARAAPTRGQQLGNAVRSGTDGDRRWGGAA